MTSIKFITIEDVDVVLEVLKQESLRGYDGLFPESQKPWVSHFFTDDRCYVLGLYDADKTLLSVLLSENITFNGCIIWYLATRVDSQNLGYGGMLLDSFEAYIKGLGVEWVFLNASTESLGFYSKKKYITSDFSKVYEHVKNL